MKKWVLIFALILLVILGVIYNQSRQPSDQIPERSIQHFLPSDSPFVVEIHNLRKLPESLSRLDLSRAVHGSPGAQFYQQRLRPMLRIFQHADPSNFPNSLLKINRYIGNQALFFADTNPVAVIGVLKLRASDTSAEKPYREHDQLLNTHIIQPLKTSKRFDYENHRTYGVTIHQFIPRPPFEKEKYELARYVQDLTLSIGRVRNHLLISLGSSTLERTLSRYRKTENPASGLFTDNTPKTFQTRFQMDPEFVSTMVENWTEIRSEIEAIPAANHLPNRKFEDLIRLQGDVFEEDGFFKLKAKFEWAPNQRPETMAQAQHQKPRKLQFDRYLPAETVFFQNQLVSDADELFSGYQNHLLRSSALADTVPKGSEWLPTKGVRPFLELHEKELGWALYYNDEFFKTISQGDNPGVSSSPVHLIMGLEMVDESSVTRALQNLGTNPFIDYNPGTQQILVDFIVGKLPIHLKREQSFLLMATDPKILGYSPQKPTNHNNLSARKSYRTVRTKLPERLNALFYFSGDNFTSPLRYPWLERFLPNRSRQIRRFMGFDPITEIHNIAGQTRPTIGGIWNEPDHARTLIRFQTSGDIIFPTALLGGIGASNAYLQNDFPASLQSYDGDLRQQTPLDTQSIGPETE